MSDSEEYYNEEEHGFYRDITTMSEEDRQDWRDSDLDSYETNMARQIHSESTKALSKDHPIDPHSDQRVRDLEDDRHAHGGANAIIAARLKEREARNPDPMANVKAAILFSGTPISGTTAKSNAIARIAIPHFVFFTNR